jgi:hypothetical protein
MPGAEDSPATRRQSDPQETADRALDEKLRQIGLDILDEPVPEKLRRVLRRQTVSDDPPGEGDGRDDDSTGRR